MFLSEKHFGKNLLQRGIIGKNFKNAPEFRDGFDNQRAVNNLFRDADMIFQIKFHDMTVALWHPFSQIAIKGYSVLSIGILF
jgi:hypothetical protein